MDPKIIQKVELHLVGIVTTGRPQEIMARISEIWNSFTQLEPQVKPYSPDQAYYGAWFGGPVEIVTYLAGMQVENLPSIPQGMEKRVVPAGTYAEFACTLGTFGPTSDFAYGQWLPAAPYDYDLSGAEIEYYPPNTNTTDSPTSLSIPIKFKETV